MRGDDPYKVVTFGDLDIVSPACAGMIPTTKFRMTERNGEPRMRGDDPFFHFPNLFSKM